MTATLEVRHEPPVDVPKPDNEDVKMWSVTTINGVLDKSALPPWAAKKTAEEAVRVAGSLQTRLQEDGPSEVVRWLSNARFRTPEGQRTAAARGTAVHAACEEYAITGVRPQVDDEIRPYFEQFDKWAQLWQPEYLAAEVTVYNETYGYAGTCDCFLKLGGMPVIGDYKTTDRSFDREGKPTGPYPEVALQLAAYRYAELAAAWRPRRHEVRSRRYYLLGPDERALGVEVPQVDGGIVIHITPEHCHAYPVKCDEQIFTSFLYVLEAARFHFETSKSVIGDRLVHPAEVA